MKKIPIGVEDFKNIISENYYYIDKTKFKFGGQNENILK